jgi:hypothetical protein
MVPIFSKRLSVDAIEKSHFSLHSKGKSKGNKIVLKFLPIIGSKKNSSPTCLLIFLISPLSAFYSGQHRGVSTVVASSQFANGGGGGHCCQIPPGLQGQSSPWRKN